MNIWLLLLGLLSPFFLSAQSTFLCSSFCVTEVTLDATNEVWNVQINFSGTASDFINYPYVSMMISDAGDTVANGQMEYFGQIGGTSQSYHPDVLSGDFTSGQIYFVFDQDTCLLNYPCGSVGIESIPPEDWSVSALSDGWRFNTSKKIDAIELYDVRGARIGKWCQVYFIPNSALPSGTYIFKVHFGEDVQTGQILRY